MRERKYKKALSCAASSALVAAVALAAGIGGQSVVSDILTGKRAINARQAKALAVRFGVSVAAFP